MRRASSAAKHSLAMRNCESLRRNFDSREAIYVEKGTILMRIRNIRTDLEKPLVLADGEELLAPPLKTGLFATHFPQRKLRWEFGAGRYTTFSDHTWQAGYGDWSLFSAPWLIRGLMDLARGWPRRLDAFERYDAVLRWIYENDAIEPTVRVFPQEDYPG